MVWREKVKTNAVRDLLTWQHTEMVEPNRMYHKKMFQD
jgi:hypothetical protein